jgi:calcineurin-like phosphoesterase family protein
MATFLISDPHYFHAGPDGGGIIRLCSRPFDGVGAMNEALRAAHNQVVKNSDDDVIFLGDFAHRAGDPKALRALFDSLAGRKHLVTGNHDGPSTLLLPWASTHEALHTSIDGVPMTLCHYAWRVWPRMRRGALMLHGHNHGRLPGNRQSADVGVDVMGWAPLRINQIKAYLATLPPLVDPEADLDGGLTP